MSLRSTPFNGDYYDGKGNVVNLMGGVKTGGRPNDRMSPFSGDFYASDGTVRNIAELAAGNNAAPYFPMDFDAYRPICTNHLT
jgi:hypothetical protein